MSLGSRQRSEVGGVESVEVALDQPCIFTGSLGEEVHRCMTEVMSILDMCCSQSYRYFTMSTMSRNFPDAVWHVVKFDDGDSASGINKAGQVVSRQDEAIHVLRQLCRKGG